MFFRVRESLKGFEGLRGRRFGEPVKAFKLGLDSFFYKGFGSSEVVKEDGCVLAMVTWGGASGLFLGAKGYM